MGVEIVAKVLDIEWRWRSRDIAQMAIKSAILSNN